MTQTPIAPAELLAPTVRRPGITRLLVFLMPPALGLLATFNGLSSVVIPAQVEEFDPVNKVRNLAILTSIAAVVALVGIPLGGALSDRTRSRFGRRAPWIVIFSIVTGAMMIGMGVSVGIVAFGIFYAATWFFANAYQGALLAVIPDRVPESRRGAVSAVVGAATPIGVLIGVQVASHAGRVWGYGILALILVVASLVFVVGARDTPSNGPTIVSEVVADVAAAKSGRKPNFLEAFRSRDFTLAFVSRFALSLGYATASGYLFYTLSDFIGTENIPGGNVAGAVTTLLTVTVIGWVLIATVFGWIADRLNRRKLFVSISAIGLAVTMTVPIISPTWTGMLVYSALLGVFIGVYFAVDLAVMSLVLPSPERAGRDFGILNVATGLPQIMSAAIAGVLISVAGGYAAIYVFGAVCSLIAGIVILFIRKVR